MENIKVPFLGNLQCAKKKKPKSNDYKVCNFFRILLENKIKHFNLHAVNYHDAIQISDQQYVFFTRLFSRNCRRRDAVGSTTL